MPPKAPSSKRGKENAPVKVKAPKPAEDVDDFDGEHTLSIHRADSKR